MDLSIIIVSCNTKKLLENCLRSINSTLERSDFSYEVIVVDNASTDSTRAFLKRQFPKVVLIQNKTNVGFGKANNQGIIKSKGHSILLLNSDTEVLPEAISNLYRFSRQHIGSFVGPKLVNPDHTPQTSTGVFFSLPVVFSILFLKGDVLGITRWSPNTTKKVDWVSGACLMATKKVFLDGLMFDEGIFMYMDEIDLLYRAHKKGYEVYFYPQSKVVHVGSGSSIDKRKGPILNIFRGLQLFYRKYHPGFQTSVLLGMLQCKALLGIIIGLMTGNRELKTTYEEALRLVQ
jgi:GT2 family glycosyltransferase